MSKMVLKWALIALVAAATPALGRAQNLEVRAFHVVANGRVAALKDWTCWFGPPGCKYAPCHMRTVQEPSLGVLRPKAHPGTIPERGGVCAGKPITMLDLIYTPRRGAHGTDSIVLETHSDNGLAHRIEITVDVP